MSEIEDLTDYEQLALAELEKASLSATRSQKRAQLDQASVFATLGEKQRNRRTDRPHGLGR